MKEIAPKGSGFFPLQFGTRPFLEAFEIADEESMELYIDPPTKERKNEKYMAYKDGQLLAVMAVKPAMDEVLRRLMKLRKDALSEMDGQQRGQQMLDHQQIPGNQKPQNR